MEDVVEDLVVARKYYKDYLVRRVFLADGDASFVKQRICFISWEK